MTPFRALVPFVSTAMALTACATSPGSAGRAVSAEALCEQVVEIVCQAQQDCCAAPTPAPHYAVDAGAADAGGRPVDSGAPRVGDASMPMGDASPRGRDAGAAAGDACTITQRSVCERTLGALASDPRLGYVPARGGALVQTLRTRAHGCWEQPFAPSELASLFVGTASDGERCTPRGALDESDLQVASLSCGAGRACRLHLDGATSAPEGACEARSVIGETVCTHPYDCASGRFCDIDGTWSPGVIGECQPLRADGWDCRGDGECASAYCDDGGRCATRPEPLRCLSVSYSELTEIDGPALYYRFGETGTTAHDASPNGEHATYVGTVTHAAGALGTSDDDGALVLAGDGHVEGPNMTLTSEALTVSLWVSVPAMGGGGPLLELVGDDASLLLRVDAGNVVASFVDRAAHATTLASTGAPIDTHFHRVVLVVSATASTLFVDGTMAATGATHALPTDGLVWIGMHDAPMMTDQRFFHGSIDELAIFDHALTSSQLARQASAAAEGSMPLTPPVFAWSE